MSEQTLSYVRIPWDDQLPIETLYQIDRSIIRFGDAIPYILLEAFELDDVADVRIVPLKRFLFESSNGGDSAVNEHHSAGIYAYASPHHNARPCYANVRATCLAMACGLHSQRFYGDVFVSMFGSVSSSMCDRRMMNMSLRQEDVALACFSPDLRSIIASQLVSSSRLENATILFPPFITPCLLDAAKLNYHDAVMIKLLGSVMHSDTGMEPQEPCHDAEIDKCEQNINHNHSAESRTVPSEETRVAVTLCLYCRCPSNNLCTFCRAAYFCATRTCRDDW